jgi:hypothetical protein
MHPTRTSVARHGRLAVVVLALLLADAPATMAATLLIQPSNQDAFIMKNSPNRITGTKNSRLRVEAAPLNRRVRRSLVQFPLGSIPPGSTVTSAVIGLYASINALNPSLTHGLFRITTPWQENAVKWNNQPASAMIPSATALVGNGRGFKSFNVTADVQSAVNFCSTDHGWFIKDVAETATNDAVAYISNNEYHPVEAENQPKITVEFAPPPCQADADCQDTNLCTTNERCEAGVCVVTTLSCDDDNPCTADVCDCGQGCRHQPVCNDGFSCTIDICDPATLECTNTPVDSACVTDCSTGTCVADPDSTTVDSTTGCAITSTTPAGTPCTDGEVCTTPDQCDGTGSCAPGPKDCGNPTCNSRPVCAEQCDNCIDDNGNGLVDRRDPQCAPLANGNGQGAGTFRGKPVLRCQKAIRAAGSGFAHQLRSRLQKCTDGVFLCLQQKPGDAVCLAKATTRCLKQTAVLQGGPTNLELRLGAKITKACGPKKPGLLPVVSVADLCDTKGLGFGSAVPACQAPQSATLLAAVTTTLADEHRCRTVQLFATDVPRAAELLTAGGVDLTALPCLIDGAQGGNLGLGKSTGVLKAAVGCQRGIGTAGARFVTQVLAAEQRCSEAVAQCLQTKPGDTKCLAKAQGVCRKVTSKLYIGSQSREAKLKTTIASACGSTTPGKAPRVALGDLRSVLGLGYDTLRSTCTVLGVPSLSVLDDVSECLVRQHVCRADQLLTSQTPRAHELLTIGGALGR